MAKPAIGIDFKMTRLFFDRSAVIKATERKERKALGAVGAVIRREARTLVRQRKRPSKRSRGRKTRPSRAGQPPVSWTKPGIRDIFFHYVPSAKSVVAGPLQFNHSPDVPGQLEHGENVRITESKYADREMPWAPGRWEDGPVETRTRTVKIRERPFMGPALANNQDKILDIFSEVGRK